MQVAAVVRIATALATAVATALGTATAHATAPATKHPRMLLDPPLRAAWQAQIQLPHGPVARAITVCSDAGTTHKYDGAQYQGSEWAKALQACLVAWAATGDPRHAATSIKFTTALIDDLDQIGDGKGGDRAAWRDSGYAIRMLAPYTALAYDWLYDQLAPELRARARQRWSSWLTWYREHGYRARAPGNNYQAGYLISATMIAIAEAGEGDPALWPLVADELWGKDMAAALASGGILDGGDWAEGWQYGPLSVAEYALAARIASRTGIPVAGIAPWLASLLRRHVYALSPGDRVYAGGDTENEEPNLDPALLTLDAVALGDAPTEDRRWARGEIARLGLHDDGFLLYDVLAAAGDPPADVPRLTWPTWYESPATGTLYARTRWDDRAVWFVTTCQHGLPVDHRHADAGNFVLSRGKDDLIVDPSPYGTQSTLTSNAPTIASGRLPRKYSPSQAAWSTRTGWDWTTQTRSGVVAARCDYSDQYRFQDRASDVPDALRDLVLLPSSDGGDASLVVVDRAVTGSSDRAMYLRFRVPGELALERSETGGGGPDGSAGGAGGRAPRGIERSETGGGGPDGSAGGAGGRAPRGIERSETGGGGPDGSAGGAGGRAPRGIERSETGGGGPDGSAGGAGGRAPRGIERSETGGGGPDGSAGGAGGRAPRGIDSDVATRTIGASRLAIASVARSAGRPVIGHTKLKDCFNEDYRGRCDAARFRVSDLRLDVDGPEPSAVHVISATAAGSAGAPRSAPLSGDGWSGVQIAGPRDAVVVWPTRRGQALAYRAPRAVAMTHVILDPHDRLAITARPDGDGCAVTTAPADAGAAHPAIVVIDDACRVTPDPAVPSAAAALPAKPPPVKRPEAQRRRRWGCSATATDGASGEPIALAAISLAISLIAARVRRRRRRARESS